MEQIIKKIEQWGYDKNIHLASPLMQTTKTLEECIELQQAIIRYDYLIQIQCTPEIYSERKAAYEDIKDAIGDIFVTLVMLSIQKIDLSLNDAEINSHYISDCINDDITELFIFMLHIQRNQLRKPIYTTQYCLKRLLDCLVGVSEYYGLTLKECIEYAYNEIKDCKGEMINGLWVKE